MPAFPLKLAIAIPTICVQRVKASNAVMYSQGESLQSPTTTLSVSRVTLTDTLHATVRTARQTLLLLRGSVMLLGRRRTLCKNVFQEINKLTKEVERLCAMADAASIVWSDEEDLRSEDDTHAAKSAVNHNCSFQFLSSPSRVILFPSKSYLLAANNLTSCHHLSLMCSLDIR